MVSITVEAVGDFYETTTDWVYSLHTGPFLHNLASWT